MQFQVPQFIETEDKIIGPLTLKQFLYIAAGGGISFLLYFTVQTWLWFALSTIVLGLATALAFVKINGQSLTHVIIMAFYFYWKPQTYVWQPDQPSLPKNESTLQGRVGGGFSLEKIIGGMALKSAWRYLQTGSKSAEEERPEEGQIKTKETYQVMRAITGERRVARRVDYR